MNLLNLAINGLGGDDKYACESPVTGSQICYDDDFGAMLIWASESNIKTQFINLAGIVVDDYIYKGLVFTPATPCRIVDTRQTSAGIISAFTQRNFHVYGSGGTMSVQGGNATGFFSPLGQPLAAHINLFAVNPTGKVNLQAFPVGAGTGAGLSVNDSTIDMNLTKAGIVKTVTGSGSDITVASNFSSTI
jgi:hypothetical protein